MDVDQDGVRCFEARAGLVDEGGDFAAVEAGIVDERWLDERRGIQAAELALVPAGKLASGEIVGVVGRAGGAEGEPKLLRDAAETQAVDPAARQLGAGRSRPEAVLRTWSRSMPSSLATKTIVRPSSERLKPSLVGVPACPMSQGIWVMMRGDPDVRQERLSVHLLRREAGGDLVRKPDIRRSRSGREACRTGLTTVLADLVVPSVGSADASARLRLRCARTEEHKSGRAVPRSVSTQDCQ